VSETKLEAGWRRMLPIPNHPSDSRCLLLVRDSVSRYICTRLHIPPLPHQSIFSFQGMLNIRCAEVLQLVLNYNAGYNVLLFAPAAESVITFTR